MLVMVVLDSVIDAQCSHHIKDKMDAYDQLIANGLSQQVTASHTVNFVSQMQSQKSARHRGWLCAPICKSQYNCLSYYYIIILHSKSHGPSIHSFIHLVHSIIASLSSLLFDWFCYSFLYLLSTQAIYVSFLSLAKLSRTVRHRFGFLWFL
jgi:hypothetical protein